jgi:hypothetical protein
MAETTNRNEATKIVREYVEHDLDEHWSGETDVIMDMPPDSLIERITDTNGSLYFHP